MAEVKLPSNVSKEQFEEWKEKFGKDPEGKETVKVIVIKSKTADLEWPCLSWRRMLPKCVTSLLLTAGLVVTK
jgi:hypothetical protein